MHSPFRNLTQSALARCVVEPVYAFDAASHACHIHVAVPWFVRIEHIVQLLETRTQFSRPHRRYSESSAPFLQPPHGSLTPQRLNRAAATQRRQGRESLQRPMTALAGTQRSSAVGNYFRANEPGRRISPSMMGHLDERGKSQSSKNTTSPRAPSISETFALQPTHRIASASWFARCK